MCCFPMLNERSKRREAGRDHPGMALRHSRGVGGRPVARCGRVRTEEATRRTMATAVRGLSAVACALAVVAGCKSESERRTEALAEEEERRLAAIHAYMVEKTGKDCPEVPRETLLIFECLTERLPKEYEERHGPRVDRTVLECVRMGEVRCWRTLPFGRDVATGLELEVEIYVTPSPSGAYHDNAYVRFRGPQGSEVDEAMCTTIGRPVWGKHHGRYLGCVPREIPERFLP